jgi:hypothetical protein
MIAIEKDVDSRFLTLSQASKLAPGRPSTNCLWRWCRHGVRSRSGERVKLRHVRMGGKIFTSVEWLEEFGEHLAQSDSQHFALREVQRGPTRAMKSQMERELEEAGI